MRFVWLILLTISCSIILSCAGRLYGPKMGITEKFYLQNKNRTFYVVDYDFSRLNRDKGIVVFSYEYRGRAGSANADTLLTLEKGFRVWEHSFSGKEHDKVEISDTVMFWGRPDLFNFGLTRSGYAVIIKQRYHKGRIVYGGRLVIGTRSLNDGGPTVEFHYDEDFLPWIRESQYNVKSIGIDTVLMSIKYWKDW